MGWRDKLEGVPVPQVIPWLGGRKLYKDGRAWRIVGKRPRMHGWNEWTMHGRHALWVRESDLDLSYGEKWESHRGYLVGDRFIHEQTTSRWEVEELAELSQEVYLVEPGLNRFPYVRVIRDPESRYIFKEELFPLGPEEEVREAFVDRKESIDGIAGVTPALDIAFRFATYQRRLLEERRAEIERALAEERRREEALRSIGTGLGRRTLAVTDFEAAARAALAVGGATLLDVRPGRVANEMVVQYALENRRLECVARKETLQIVDSGICLTDHHTNEKGDTYFTLESLPSVVQEAIRDHKLVVYRHVEGDRDYRYDDYDDDDDY